MSKTPELPEETEDDFNEVRYIEELMDDFDLKETDTLGDLIKALEEEDENCEDEDNDDKP